MNYNPTIDYKKYFKSRQDILSPEARVTYLRQTWGGYAFSYENIFCIVSNGGIYCYNASNRKELELIDHEATYVHFEYKNYKHGHDLENYHTYNHVKTLFINLETMEFHATVKSKGFLGHCIERWKVIYYFETPNYTIRYLREKHRVFMGKKGSKLKLACRGDNFYPLRIFDEGNKCHIVSRDRTYMMDWLECTGVTLITETNMRYMGEGYYAKDTRPYGFWKRGVSFESVGEPLAVRKGKLFTMHNRMLRIQDIKTGTFKLIDMDGPVIRDTHVNENCDTVMVGSTVVTLK